VHTSSTVTLALAVFLASAVESVEALTIVVAAGVSRGWRSALEGAAVAVAVLVALVAALGPALVYLVPIDVLRAVVGTLLLVFGLQWLRKAVLRSAGRQAKHDEDAIFKKHVDALAPGGGAPEGSGTGSKRPTGFVGTGVVALLVRAASLNSVAVVSLPALVIVLLAASLSRARHAKH
jgi:putative Ca2+/H+ antiporter (TMEM165/GDT1 family)